MPTYEYECSGCGHTWEAEQRITAGALTSCPKCNRDKAKRQIGKPMFILQGGGWESDGYSRTDK